MDPIPDEKKFRNQSCSDIFCNDCITRYVPSCKEVIECEQCRWIIPKEVFDRWGDILCENSVVEADKFFCPFKDCSAMLIRDGEKDVSSSECPHCNRLFYAQCKVPSHAGMNCEEFQRLEASKGGENEYLMTTLAEEKGTLRMEWNYPSNTH
ncbi:uncharacterized protein LOC106778157 [Vigna radiata var. radiata]|uniref:RBR-type E3 ubiquitin transferase n=1 Tax=Vigna radiata var. radiata TaxID=3916 RepID=A0A1S3VT61_VIGRR|nr:uncharacterized protein LOC106778157 [Vigna radiata var. radiata]